MATKTQDLAHALIAALDASPIGRDEKIKALGLARNHVNRQPVGSNWRSFVGPVGSGKKTQALLDTMHEQAVDRDIAKRTRSKKSAGQKL